jgi:arsenate reductase-like glutaredoxin family protein
LRFSKNQTITTIDGQCFYTRRVAGRIEGGGMLFFGLKTCDTCRKALAALRAGGVMPTVVDVRADGITEDQLRSIVAAFEAGAVNRASATWRGLAEEERALPVEVLIARYPTVMKRPVIEHDGRWFMGWDAKVQAALGL